MLNKVSILTITFIGIFFDILLVKGSYDILNLIFVLLWVISLVNFKFNSQVSGSISLLFIFLIPLLLLAGEEIMAEKTAVWAFFFLSVTVGQQILEVKKEDV